MSSVVPLRPRAVTPGAPLAERSDDDLMLLARGGMPAALAALVARHNARLAGYCAKLLGSRILADEICQETWLRIWSHRASYRSEGKFTVLLFVAARNACRNHARATRRRARWLPEVDMADEPVSDDRPDHLDALVERERRRDVLRALGELPEAMREALLLRFEQDLSYEDMTAILDTPESTLRSRVHHGLKQLRGILAKGGGR
jgi:RNA polymerase sigma-70 factor (ECF subfamily)